MVGHAKHAAEWLLSFVIILLYDEILVLNHRIKHKNVKATFLGAIYITFTDREIATSLCSGTQIAGVKEPVDMCGNWT